MVEVPDQVQRLREQAADRLSQLVAAAADSTAALGKDARIAQHRADAALRVLRGNRPPGRWRWVAVGLVVGLAAGVVLAQRRTRQALNLDDQVGAIAGMARETTASARAKATQLREKLPGTPSGDPTNDTDASDQ
ncbi:MAG TPA: hypothetical protein VF049_04950 [Nocardioidaceae bacterium]